MRSLLARLSEKVGPAQSKTPAKPADTRPEVRNAPQGNVQRIEGMKRRLIQKRKWAYLRYIHAREALILAKDVESVLVVGSGHGYAEITLALEFPKIHFHLTDVVTETTPNYHNAQKLVKQWGLSNVTFGIRDILAPERGRYDMVSSVEVLEHIQNDALAVAQMRAAANKYVFALVPFAEKAANSDTARRARVFENLGHHVVGYDEEDLRKLFPGISVVRGCYWREYGGAHRKRLYSMSAEEIKAHMDELQSEAQRDIVNAMPETTSDAQGVWLLDEV